MSQEETEDILKKSERGVKILEIKRILEKHAIDDPILDWDPFWHAVYLEINDCLEKDGYY